MGMSGDGKTPYLRLWRDILGQAPGLDLRRVRLRAFTEADWRELRDDFNATEAMIRELRRLAAEVMDDRDVRIDFEAETVTPLQPPD